MRRHRSSPAKILARSPHFYAFMPDPTCTPATCFYDSNVELGRGHGWRRFSHKYGLAFFVVCVIAVILALVAFLMFVLTSPDWRLRE